MRRLLLSFLCLLFMVNSANAANLVPMANGLSALQFYENLTQPSNVFKSIVWEGKLEDESYPHYQFDSYMIWATPHADVIGMAIGDNGEPSPIIVRVNRDTGEIIGLKMFFRSDAGSYSGAKTMALILYSIFGSDHRDYRPIANGIDRFFSGEDKVLEQIESSGKSLYLGRSFPKNNNECMVAVFTVIP